MYRILYNDRTIFDPYGDDDEVVTDAVMDSGENASTYLDFTMSVKHPLYNVIAERDGTVRLYWDSALLFEGVIESIQTDIELNKTVSCIGPMDYLNDSVVRPYSTIDGEEALTAPSSVEGLFQWLIDQHNEHVLDQSKSFSVGVNQGASLKKSSYIYASSNSYPTTASEIENQIIDAYGGYLFVRYENGLRILDLYADIHEMNAQVIDFGVNITDFSKTLDTKDQYTALIPQGGSPTFQNGDLENGYDHWAIHDGAVITADAAHAGSSAFYVTSGSATHVNDSFFYLKPGYRYKATAWVRNDRTASVTIHLCYQINTDGSWKDSSDVGTLDIPVKDANSEESQWTEFTLDFLPTPSVENAKIRPKWYFTWFSNDSGRRVYLDDFDFTRLDGEDNVSEDPIDLTLIPDGPTTVDSDIAKQGDAIYSVSNSLRYGYKETTYSNDSLTTVEDLLEQSAIELRKQMAPKLTIEVKAVDLSLYMDGYDHLSVGQAVRVRSVPHDVDEYLTVNSISLDLQHPGQTDYTLGTAYDTLTGQQSGYLKSLNAGINYSLDSVASLDQSVKDQAIVIGSVQEVANDAKDTANNAQNTANSAQQAAQDAQNSASSALDKAEAAEGAVNEIQGMIDDINSGAEQAKQDAAQAKADAQQAAAKADAAAEKADSYQQQITDVTTTVNGVAQEVEGYSAQISGAVQDADAALSAVTSLEADVDGFKTSVSQTYQTKQDAAEQMAQEVLDRNSAIEQSASEITQSVSETYQVKGDYLTEGQAAEVYASKAELSTTADAITATVEEKFDDSLLVKEADGGIVDCGDTAGMPLAGLTVYGQTRQNLWVNEAFSNNGITATSNANGSMTVSGTNSGTDNAWSGAIMHYNLKPGATYTASVDKAIGSSTSVAYFRVVERTDSGSWIKEHRFGFGSSLSVTFTTDSSMGGVSFDALVLQGQTVSGTFRIMLNEGSEAQAWCPPGLDSVEDVTVWQAGKNLCLIPPIEDAFVWAGYSPVVDEINKTIDILNSLKGIPLTMTCTVTMRSADDASKIPKSMTGILVRTANHGDLTSQRSWGSGAAIGTTKTIVYKFTVPEDAVVTNFYMYGCGNSNDASDRTNGNVDMKIQIELGDESTDYESPNVTPTPIDLLGNKVSSLPDGTRDELVVDASGNVVLRKNVGYVELDGTQTWTWQTDKTSAYWEHDDIVRMADYSDSMLCDKLPVKKNYADDLDMPQHISGYHSSTSYFGQNWVYARTPGAEDANDVKTWFSSNSTMLLYQRVEQTTIPLGTVVLPDLPEQNAHVWISTGTQGLDPDIHATWYGENASALKDFASKAELKIESDQIKATVEETYSTKEEVSAVEDKADATQNALDSYKNTVSTTYATKSEVTQTANTIKSEVSEEYVSKDDASATYATKTSVSTVEQTVDSLTSTVSSNYTTLNNKFGSYYTKTQVDQKDNSIKSTVSEVQTTANSALTKATTVEQTADGLEVRLTQAEKDVDTASTNATNALNRVTLKDTRNDNQNPQWYMTNYPRQQVQEFKYCSKIGLSGVGTYCYLTTYVPWDDSSGGYPKQTAKVDSSGKEYWRSGTSNTAWSAWVDAYGTASNAAKTATNYLKFDSTGLVVGNHTGTLQGNTQITSTGVNIRNGTTNLATFTPSTIELGANSQGAEVKLAAGSGILRGYNNNGYPGISVRAVDGSFLAVEPNHLKSDVASGAGGHFAFDMYTNGNVSYVSGTVSTGANTEISFNSPLQNLASVMAPDTLYNSSSGTYGDVPLSYPVSNYRYLLIFSSGNDDVRFPAVVVIAENGKSFDTSVALSGDSWAINMRGRWTMNGSKLSLVINGTYEISRGVWTPNSVKIIRVLGFK